MTFSDFDEIVSGLYIGSHPEPEDPFELGATIVVSLTTGTSGRSVPRNGVLIIGPSRMDRSPNRRSSTASRRSSA